MRADDIMTKKVATVTEDSTITEVLELLSKLTIRHVPVLSEDEELVGMVSDRDLRDVGLSVLADETDLARLRALRTTAVSKVMRTDLMTVAPNTPITDVIDMMVEEHVGAVPVVDERENRLVGIISYVDVLRAAAKLM